MVMVVYLFEKRGFAQKLRQLLESLAAAMTKAFGGKWPAYWFAGFPGAPCPSSIAAHRQATDIQS